MQCRDFREISEAYLSDELLVETNLQVFRHMENCQSCRSDFAARRALRMKVRSAVVDSPEFAMSDEFARDLAIRLRDTAVSNSGWRGIFAMPRILVPAFAALVIAVFAGLVAYQYNPTSTTSDLANIKIGLTSYLTEVSFKAIGNHEHCALDKMEVWESGNLPVSEDGTEMANKVIGPLRASFSENVEILHSHDCIYEGRRFSHVIVRRYGRTLSVFFDRSNEPRHLAAEEGVNESIICNKENGMQVASFRVNGFAVFVVSDMPESENLEIARSLSDSMSV